MSAQPIQPVSEGTALTVHSPERPNITPAQIVSGIPILAELAHSFGIFDLSQAQQDSLGKAVTWAMVLVGSDAVLRVGRNLAHRLR